MVRLSWIWLSLVLLVSNASAQPQIELRFGPEEEFRSPKQIKDAKAKIWRVLLNPQPQEWKYRFAELSNNEVTREDIKGFVEKLKMACSTWDGVTCHIEQKKDPVFLGETIPELHYQAQTEAGEPIVGHFTFSNDPGVLEIHSNPLSLRDLDSVPGQLYDSILGLLKQNQWKLAGIGGEGHFHIDLRASFGIIENGRVNPEKIDLKRFYNFVASWLDHNELTWGVLNYDPKSLGANPHFAERYQEIDSYLFYLERLAKAARGKYPYPNWDFFYSQFVKLSPFQKGEALNLNTHLGTMEFRIFKPKTSLSEMKAAYTLVEKWVNWAERQPKLIEFQGGYAPKDWREAVSRYYVLTQEIGMDWPQAKSLMPPVIRWIPPSTTTPFPELFSSKKYVPSKSFKSVGWICNQLFRNPTIRPALIRPGL